MNEPSLLQGLGDHRIEERCEVCDARLWEQLNGYRYCPMAGFLSHMRARVAQGPDKP